MFVRLSERLDLVLEDQLDQVVKAEIGGLERRLEDEVAFLRFTNLVRRLADPDVDSFSHDDRDAMVDLLKQLLETESATKRGEFVSLVYGAVDVFMSAGLIHLVDDIEVILREVSSSSELLSLKFLVHYQRLALAQDNLGDGYLVRVKEYWGPAHVHKQSHLVLLSEALCAYIENESARNERTTSRLNELASFPQDKKAQIRLLLQDLGQRIDTDDPNLMTLSVNECSSVIQQFERDYESELQTLPSAHEWIELLNAVGASHK